jgi:Ca-activated chloride channel homolog
MLSFAHPEWFLLAPLLLLVGVWRFRRRESALGFSSLRLVRDLPRGRARWSRVVMLSLSGLGLAFLMIAAASPRRPDFRTPIEPEGVAMVFVVDVSGSMGTEDFPRRSNSKTSRLIAAQEAFRCLVEGGDFDGRTFPGRPRDNIGIVAFSAVSRTVCPLTLNHTVALRTLTDLKPKSGVDAGTNLGDAVAEALIRLEASNAKRRVIVLLSDGEHNTPSAPEGPLKPADAANLAKSVGVVIHAIDCGGTLSPAATPDDARQRLSGQAIMQMLALNTGGQSFTASDREQLGEVSQQLDQLERQPQTPYRYRRYHEDAHLWALAGVTCLALARLMSLTRWRIWPG